MIAGTLRSPPLPHILRQVSAPGAGFERPASFAVASHRRCAPGVCAVRGCAAVYGRGRKVSNQSGRESLRDVLVVSYYFPPCGGPGVQRVLKFVRYLPDNGYRPHVLTVSESADFPVRDPSLAAEVPAQARVHRSPVCEFYSLYHLINRSPGSRTVQLATSAREARGLRARILRLLRGSLFIPDGRMGWYPGGIRAGRRICREEPVKLIFASGPPFTAHWIAARLAGKTGLPLVLDFRDPWIGAPFYPTRPGWAGRLDRRLESSCLRRASAVLTVNREIREDLLHRHRFLEPDSVRILPNGFDPADFAGATEPAAEEWTLAHTGTLPARRFPEGLVPGLIEFMRTEPAAAGSMRLHLAGSIDPDLRPVIFQPGLEPVLQDEGYLPHAESVRLLRRSHLLLLLIEDGPRAGGILTGKLFEYLASGRPILALAPEGEAADLIRRTRAGRVVSGDDPGAVTAALREAFDAYRTGRRPFCEPDAEAIAAFARDRLTARLAGLFDELLGRGASG